MIVNGFLAFIAYKLKALTLKGVILAFFLGVIVFYVCIEAYVVLFVYFLSIVLIEKAVLKRKKEQRTEKQILSNFIFAFIAVSLYISFKEFDFFVLYCSMLSVSICDTISSTMGTRFAKKVYSITRFKRINQGVSGGVSVCGCVAGFVTVVLFSFVCAIVCIIMQLPLDVDSVLYIVIAGYLGMIIDSVLGDIFQKKYYCKICKNISDHKFCCSVQGEKVGIGILSNSQVNIASEAIVFVVSIILIICNT